VCFSVFTSLFIESKETLETLKIVGFSPYVLRTLQNPNKITFHKIGLRLLFSSCTSVLDRRSCALDRNSTIDPILARASAGALVPYLERVFERGCAPFGFGSAHQVLDKMLEPVFTMPRVRAFSPQSSRTLATVAQPTFQTRKLILETLLSIHDDFMDFNGTRWAIQEFKRRGLKRLFKPITSTAYACLVRTYYGHLTYDCNRPDILL
jgi:hypothetical protein